MINDLEFLARQYGTDKNSLPGNNGYLSLYVEYFNKVGINRDSFLNILEIGTNAGKSLRMWAEYFVNAEVFGVDITREYEIPELLNHSRIHTSIRGSDEKLSVHLKKIYGKQEWNLLIDDGSHEASEVWQDFGDMFFYLKPKGLYVIEDLVVGRNFLDANTYNKKRIIPVRQLVQELEQTGNLKECPAISESEFNYIKNNLAFCEYRETASKVFTRWNSEIAFIGHK